MVKSDAAESNWLNISNSKTMSTEDSNTSLSPELVAFIHHSLVSLDYSNVQVKVGVAAAGAIVFTALFFLLHVLFHLTTPVYSGLSLKHKVGDVFFTQPFEIL